MKITINHSSATLILTGAIVLNYVIIWALIKNYVVRDGIGFVKTIKEMHELIRDKLADCTITTKEKITGMITLFLFYVVLMLQVSIIDTICTGIKRIVTIVTKKPQKQPTSAIVSDCCHAPIHTLYNGKTPFCHVCHACRLPCSAITNPVHNKNTITK